MYGAPAMATTESRDPDTLPYAEHDKLGPLGSRPSALHDPVELRAKLIAEFNSAVNAARDAAQSIDEGSAKSVHESRKALRRGRAVLAMIASALPKSERRAVKEALQEARRSLSMIRDHSVAPETLGQLALGDDDRDTAKRVLDSAAEAIPPMAEIKQLLGEAAARAAAQAEALQAALPPQLSWDDLAYGIRELYGLARRARRGSKVSKQWFHSWRRRTKELSYALDFIARQAGPRAAAIQSELDGIADLQGPTVDLIMVREFVETHGVGVSPDAVDHLRKTVEVQLEDLMKAARKAGRDSFALKPKKFEKRLTKAVRRDLTPPDEARTNGISE
jgi:CHAD domain-containing protein